MSKRLYVAANGMGPNEQGAVAILQRSNSLRTLEPRYKLSTLPFFFNHTNILYNILGRQ